MSVAGLDVVRMEGLLARVERDRPIHHASAASQMAPRAGRDPVRYGGAQPITYTNTLMLAGSAGTWKA